MATIILDLDGVIYIERTPVPGAAAALQSLQRAGHQLLFVTNNATRHLDAIIAEIEDRVGFTADRRSVISSSMAAAAMIHGRATTAFVVGEEGLVATLADAGIVSVATAADAQAVVVGLDRAVTYERLRDAALAIRRGALFIATNLDATFPTPSGLWPGGGALVAALVVASGRDPELAGKPAAPMRDLVRSRVEQDQVWVVGDRPDTDLALGEAEGWNTVLVLTGVTSSAEGVSPAPTVVLDSAADLPSLFS